MGINVHLPTEFLWPYDIIDYLLFHLAGFSITISHSMCIISQEKVILVNYNPNSGIQVIYCEGELSNPATKISSKILFHPLCNGDY